MIYAPFEFFLFDAFLFDVPVYIGHTGFAWICGDLLLFCMSSPPASTSGDKLFLHIQMNALKTKDIPGVLARKSTVRWKTF